MSISGRKLSGLRPEEKGLVIPFPVGIDLTTLGLIAEQALGFEINTAPPCIEFQNAGIGANQVAEVMLFNYAAVARSFFANDLLAFSQTLSGTLRHVYRLRGHVTMHDGFTSVSATQCKGIAHGSFGGQQPWSNTPANVVAQLRVMGSATVPYDVQLLYAAGGGAAVVTKTIGRLNNTSGDFGTFLELVIDYPNRKIEGWVDGKFMGDLSMVGWNGSRLPAQNSLGKTPWMSIFSATGSGVGAANWYDEWLGLEMIIPLNFLKP